MTNMALTIGGGPLDHPHSGAYNFNIDGDAPDKILYLDDVSKRIRGRIDGETIVDTRRAKLLHETGEFIQWYIPTADVRMDLLEKTARVFVDPFKGRAICYGIRNGERLVSDAAWAFEDIPMAMPDLVGLIAFDFDKLDEWMEEDERVLGHPRDPFHRFDCRASSDRVEVRVGCETVASSARTIKLFETGGVTRYYFPLADVSPDALEASPTRGYCPYKGAEAFFHVKGGGLRLEDDAWTITEPLGEAQVLGGYVSFWREPIEILVEGERVPV